MRRRRLIRTAMTVAATAALVVPSVSVAHAGRIGPAGGADTLVASGTCSRGGVWIMGARAQNRGIGVKVRIRAGRPGQVWRVVLTHNGAVVTKGAKVTSPRRMVMVRARTVNLPGVDTYSFVAQNPAAGATCTGTLAY